MPRALGRDVAQFGPLLRSPLEVDLKTNSSEVRDLVEYLDQHLSKALRRHSMRFWYRPDRANTNRYFWIYMHETNEKDDYVLIMNVSPQYAKSRVTLHYRFLEVPRPSRTALLPDEYVRSLDRIGTTRNFIKLSSRTDIDRHLPYVLEYVRLIQAAVNRGWRIPRRGSSTYEIEMRAFLREADSPNWECWGKPPFLVKKGRMHLDLYLCEDDRVKIGMEIQGDKFHPRPEDFVKKELCEENKWRLIWIWESQLKRRESYAIALRALSLIRGGEMFIDARDLR